MEVNIYSKNIEFTYSDCDCNDHVFPKKIFQVLQDIAGEHAKFLGIGYNAFIEQNLIWVLVRNSYELIGKLECYKQYTLKTFPLQPKGFTIQRDYWIYDANNKLICQGTSLWSIVDFVKRSLVRINNLQFPIFQSNFIYADIETSLNSLGTLNKISDSYQKVGNHRFSFSELDHNKHVNNTEYSKLILDYIFECYKTSKIKFFQINFDKECNLNDEVTVYMRKTENIVDVILKVGHEVCITSKVEVSYD